MMTLSRLPRTPSTVANTAPRGRMLPARRACCIADMASQQAATPTTKAKSTRYMPRCGLLPTPSSAARTLSPPRKNAASARWRTEGSGGRVGRGGPAGRPGAGRPSAPGPFPQRGAESGGVPCGGPGPFPGGCGGASQGAGAGGGYPPGAGAGPWPPGCSGKCSRGSPGSFGAGCSSAGRSSFGRSPAGRPSAGCSPFGCSGVLSGGRGLWSAGRAWSSLVVTLLGMM